MSMRYPPIEIQTPEQVATAGLARWMLYGLNGSGKTTFLSTIPTDVPTWVISADEENVDVLRGLKHVKVTKIARWNQIGEIYQRAATALADPDVVSGKKKWFKCIAFDTWTRIQVLARNKIVLYEPAGPADAVKYIDRAPTLPKGYEAWQQIGALAGEWMRNFCRLPIHTIFLAQEEKYDPKGGNDALRVNAALTKTALVEAMTALKLVGRLYVSLEDEEGNALGELGALDPLHIPEDAREVRKLLVGKHPTYATKGDTRRLGYVVRDPSWAKLERALLSPEALSTGGGRNLAEAVPVAPNGTAEKEGEL